MSAGEEENEEYERKEEREEWGRIKMTSFNSLNECQPFAFSLSPQRKVDTFGLVST